MIFSLFFYKISLKIDLLADIFEHGVEAFSQHILQSQNNNLKHEEISLVSSQFLSYKEFSEKLNNLIREISKMQFITNLENLMKFVNKNFKKVFVSEKINLWMADSVKFKFLRFFQFLLKK